MIRSADDPPPPFVDAHVHFYDLDAGTPLRWDWIDRRLEPPIPDLAAVRARRFLPTDLMAEGGRLGGLTSCVHVQAASEDGDPVAETRWLAALRERHGAPEAAVVRVPLDATDAERVLDAQCEFPWVRGVRDLGKTALLEDDAYARAVRRLAARGLHFEVVCGPKRFDSLATLARRCPDTVIVLEHFGVPSSRPERVAAWRTALPAVAAHDNVRIKLSGLALSHHAWSFGYAAELIEFVLDQFGPRRCFAGSNFPIDRAAASYPDVVHAVRAGTDALSAADRHAVLAGNAEQLYRLESRASAERSASQRIKVGGI